MDTSIRYGGESSALRNIGASPTVKYAGNVSAVRINANQKLQFRNSNILLQLNGELDTGTGAPTFLCALVRQFYPSPTPHGALELVWNILDFQKDQDVRLKVGYELVDKLNGELDTGTGAPTFLCALVRQFYPNLSSSLGAGLHYDQNEKLRCTLCGKKAYPVAFNRFVNFVLKERCDIDQELNLPTPHGALELVWNILDFQKEQDVRLKVGYELVDKIPYVQLRENNWTFNADISGRWDVRYNL